MILQVPIQKIISKEIPPNYSSWQSIELTYQCCKYVINNNIPGVFVECGVAAGNNLAAMCKAGRFGFGFDSFEGIPWAGYKDKEQPGIGEIDPTKIGLLESSGITVHSLPDVISDFKKWNIKNYALIKGWFQDTIWYWQGNISVLRLDGDLYSSTDECLRALYPWLSEGGILIIDDWNLDGCREAVIDFFKGKLPREIFRHDNPIYFQK